MAGSSLDLPLHPAVTAWFRARFGEPTEVQARTWPLVAAGRHLLATAPTGSGKTLAAFLVALDRLLTGAWETGGTRVLYLSPLKALNADIERNLVSPLTQLGEALRRAGLDPPTIRVATRSGDTPEVERRRLIRSPPEILATTPESLNLLLLSSGGRRVLEGVRLVVLDEIHAVVDSRRGLHLMSAVERLSRLAGDPQRLALSATVAPLDVVARFVGGYRLTDREGEARFEPREVEVLDCRGPKRLELEVISCLAASPDPRPDEEQIAEAPPPHVGPADENPFWETLRADLERRIRANRTSLVFANSRRMAEKVTRLLNRDAPGELAYSHHGSLAREVRQVVEARFKAGQLPAIVATSSLELGIDIGDLDEVLLLQSPPSIASAIQRVGRAGHQVGAVSHGRLYPTHGRDLLVGAVLARAAADQAVEPIRPIGPALDVLAQVVLGETVDEAVPLDLLYDRVRCASPWRELPRPHFDLVVEALAGRFADSPLKELASRLLIDRVANTALARRGVRRLLAQSGGTIPDRGYFHLRLAGTRARLGELDEEFVWERSVGDAFVLGAQSWRIVEITHNDVLVAPGRADAPLAPFWKGEERDRPFAFARLLADTMVELEALVADHPVAPVHGPDPLADVLGGRFPLDGRAATDLAGLLRRQRLATGAPLPHRHHLLVEEVREPTRENPTIRLLLHTGWGGAVNRTYTLALAAAWERRFGASCVALHDDDMVLIEAPHPIEPSELIALVAPEELESLVRERLPRTGYFGARFREVAQVAMVLPRGDASRRIPLWLNRQRSKRLLETVAREPEFPLTLETWRTCLAEGLDFDHLREELLAWREGRVTVSHRLTSSPSPLASNLIWRQTNQRMYEDDTPEGQPATPRASLLDELLLGGNVHIETAALSELETKLARTAPGWAPAWGPELVSLIEERVALDPAELEELLAAIERDSGPPPEGHEAFLAERVVQLEPAELQLTAVLGIARRLEAALDPNGDEDLAPLLRDWLASRGPRSEAELSRHFGAQVVREALETLADTLASGVPCPGRSQPCWCDRDNLERLIRLGRRARQPRLELRPLAELPLFLAAWTGLTTAPADPENGDLSRALGFLAGYPLAPPALEGELLPARLPSYQPMWLDRLVAAGGWVWTGAGRRKLVLCRLEEIDLLEPDATEDPELLARLAPPGERTSELARALGIELGPTAERLWDLVWAGLVTNEDLGELRRAIARDFGPLSAREARAADVSSPRRSGRAALARFRSAWGAGGRWLALPHLEEELDPLETLELDKERCRLVLRRYGVVFRELLGREHSSLSWGRLFRALRLMELGGEIVSGAFFEGVLGPQFATPSAVSRLASPLPDEASWWCSVLDPAAPCGLGFEGLGRLPRRIAGNALAYRGAKPVLLLEGRKLRVDLAPDDPDLPSALAPITNRLGRLAHPEPSIEIETINGEDAGRSPYLGALASLAEVSRGSRGIRLWRGWRPRP